MIGLDGKEMFLTGIGGFTYNFSTNPVSIFANYRPKVEFPTFDVLSSSDIRIGISYRF
jgi:glutaredoxin-related protein